MAEAITNPPFCCREAGLRRFESPERGEESIVTFLLKQEGMCILKMTTEAVAEQLFPRCVVYTLSQSDITN